MACAVRSLKLTFWEEIKVQSHFGLVVNSEKKCRTLGVLGSYKSGTKSRYDILVLYKVPANVKS